MARIRSTHPGQWTAGDFLECSPLARLLALALRNVADDHGIFRWKPKTLKAECLPADNCDIDQLLTELVSNDQVKRYTIEGKEYGLIVDFTQWQRPKKPKYVHPIPDWFSTSTVLVENQDDTDTEIPPQRKEEGGRREEVEEDSRVAGAPEASDSFEEFWKAFPRRDGPNPRKPAEQKFNALVKTGVDPAIMLAAVKQLAIDEGKRGQIGTRYIPQTVTWLNQQRWTDHAAIAFTPDLPEKLGWDEALTSFKRTGQWSRYAPASDIGQAPPDLLTKYGLMADGRRVQ